MAVIGIDIGGTKIKAGLVSETGEISSVITVRTDIAGTMAQTKLAVEELLDKHSGEIEAIGIGTAGRVDFASGTIVFATPNLLNWTGTPVKKILEESYQLPAAVDNDANTAAIAEGYFGAAKPYHDYVCLTLGTGVGAGIAANRQLLRGKAGAAGEVGHMQFSFNGLPCNCGRSGCWEQYVSGTALHNAIKQNERLLARNTTPEQLFERYQNGDRDAGMIVESFVDYLAAGLASLQNTIDPECFIIGGGLIASSHIWFKPLEEKLRNYDQPIAIKKAVFDNEAGLLGAGVLAYQAIGKL